MTRLASIAAARAVLAASIVAWPASAALADAAAVRAVSAAAAGAAAPAAPASIAPSSDCDRLAAHPEDPQRVTPGVEREQIDLPVAIAACERAVAEHPSTPRFRYQLARLLFYANQNVRAVEQMRRAADDGYPQAQFVFGTFITRGRPGAPTDVCLAESYWRRSAAGGRQAARVQYLRYTLKGRFADCTAAASGEQLLEMLEAATGAARDFYEGLLVEDLGEALVALRGVPPAAAPAARP